MILIIYAKTRMHYDHFREKFKSIYVLEKV